MEVVTTAAKILSRLKRIYDEYAEREHKHKDFEQCDVIHLYSGSVLSRHSRRTTLTSVCLVLEIGSYVYQP